MKDEDGEGKVGIWVRDQPHFHESRAALAPPKAWQVNW